MESLLKDIYSLIYDKLDTNDMCALAHMCPHSYRAAMLHLRNRASQIESHLCNLRTSGQYRFMPLLLACAHRDDISRELILAAADNDEEAVGIYIRAGADPSIQDSEALDRAAVCGSEHIVWMILVTGRIPVKKCSLLLEKVVDAGRNDILRMLLLQPGIQVDKNGNGALVTACSECNEEAVNMLLLRGKLSGANNAGFDDAFIQAAENGNAAIIRHMIQDGRVPLHAFTDALIVACKHRNIRTVEVLIRDKRADPTWGRNDALFVAVRDGHPEMVRTLLNDPRVDPTAYHHGTDLLTMAKRNAQPEIEKMLLAWRPK
jgi:ankyrin repeat protein